MSLSRISRGDEDASRRCASMLGCHVTRARARVRASSCPCLPHELAVGVQAGRHCHALPRQGVGRRHLWPAPLPEVTRNLHGSSGQAADSDQKTVQNGQRAKLPAGFTSALK